MKIDPDLRHRALRTAVGVLETARDPAHTLTHALPMLDGLVNSSLGEQGRERLLQDPELQALGEEQYWGPWPSAEELRRLPPGSLGRLHQERFDRLGLHTVPAPDTAHLDGPGAYLQRRLRATHDLHHVVLAIPSDVAGEASGSAYYASALRQPGSIAVLTAWMVHSYLAPEEETQIWDGIRFGLELSRALGPRLLAMRWEEGWAEPIATWRERIGLTELLSRTPFPGELALMR
jgi:ubiquinone biosynthesis protein COQ4